MAKEMFISSSPHETKVAVLEDDQLVEVYYERDTAVGLVGGIYKGRVSRVLPGMQSAFVDIGLERDAFLYVSDYFFEDQEEYDKVFEEAESRATRYTAESSPATQTTGLAGPQGVAPDVMTFPAPPAAGEAVEPSVSAAVPEAAAREIPPAEPAAPLHTEVAPAPPPPVSTPGGVGRAEAGPTPPAPPARTTGGEGPEHRRFDPRGRRRRRGRHDFTEHRRPERQFTPPPEYARPHTFEILPGESLAKYSHVSPSAPKEESSATAEVVGTPPHPGANGDLQPTPVTPAGTGEAGGRSYVAEEEVQPPPATTTVEGPEEVAPPSPALVKPEFPSTSQSEAEQHQGPGDIEGSRTAATPQADVIPQMTGGPTEPLAEAPAAPTSVEGPQPVAGAAEPGRIQTPPVSEPLQSAASPEAAPTAIPQGETTAPALPPEVAAADSTPDRAPEAVTQGQAEPARGGEVIETASTDAGEHLPGSAPEPVVPSEAGPAPEALPDGGPAPLAASPQPGREPEAPPGGGDRTYTLREPHQRPRFAPRRGRRGRRGAGPRNRPPSREAPRPGNHQPLQIAEMLKEGQEILVQIAKEPLGTKGARITSHVALPGRYLVYMPTIEHIGVSRKIASEEERLRLRNIILENKGSLTGGFIVRTAGQGRSVEEFKADLRFLSALWSEIRAKAEKAKSPALIHRDLDLVQRLLRDTLTPDFKNIRVDNEIEYERVLDFVSRSQPSLVGKVKLYTRDTPLFEEFGIQAEIEKALRPKVWLRSGGYIVINQTEALVAVDVNTGKYVGKTNRLEDTILKTNIDAVNEIVRQIRLRDLGGIIVIDFIDMDERKNRMRVVQALEEALRHDRAPTKVIAFHDFGLVAITRKRVKQSLERTLCEPCSACAGSGWIKSVTTVCYEILAEAKKMTRQIEGDSLTLRVNPEVAKALKSREGVLISELESMTHKDVIVKSDPVVPQERFEIF